jgi:hypothetical protein
VTREEIGFVVACSILIAVIIGGIFSDWYGVQSDRRPVPSPIGTAKPTRPPHPVNIYYPPGEPAPKVPGDPGWRKS